MGLRPMTSAPGEMKYIAIIESGYWVRFHVGTHSNKTGQKQKLDKHRTFPVRDFGGSWLEALKEAKTYRDSYLSSSNHGHNYPRWGVAFKNARKDNGTDTPGVTLVRRALVSGTTYSYRASWRQTLKSGERVGRSTCYIFNPDDESSERKAFKRAKRKREEMRILHYTGDR